MIWFEIRGAFGLLTTLGGGAADVGEPGRFFAWFPLVGLTIGVPVALLTALPLVPTDLRALVALLGWVGLTGGLHLDGFADSCDGLFVSAPPERRLDIMHDPHTGSWAVVGLIVLLIGKWIVLRTAPPLLTVVPPILGRWAMVLAAWHFPPSPLSGMGAHFRRGLGHVQVVIATALALIFSAAVLLAVNWRTICVVGAVPLIVWLTGRWAARRLGGGLTGDVYGAICELTEWICLTLLSFLH